MDETIRTAAMSPLRQRLIDDMNMAGSRGRHSTTTFATWDALQRSWGAHLIRRPRTRYAVPDRTARCRRADADHEQHRVPDAFFFTHPSTGLTWPAS